MLLRRYGCPGDHGCCVLMLIVVAAVVFAGACAVGHANEIRAIRWRPRDDALRFEVTVAEAGGFGVTDTIARDGALRLEIADVNQPFRNQSLLIRDDRIEKCLLSYDEGKKLLAITFRAAAGVTARQTSETKPVAKIIIDFVSAAPRADRQTIVEAPGIAARPPDGKRVVIIDPGHGGTLLGAFTRKKIGGRQLIEKDITLDMARMLKAMIDETPGMAAYLTREKDEDVSLRARRDFAVQREGDLFVSIHCNSTPGNRASDACGAEFYYWNEKGSDDAAVRWLEEQENAGELEAAINNHSTLKGLLVNILKDQLEVEAAGSERFCETLQRSFTQHAYFASRCRGIKSARFKVLENYAMPSVLVEVGFLSNTKEARKLAERQFQYEIAALLVRGIRAHFEQDAAGAGN